MEKFEYHGIFWVPEYREQKVAGLLKFDPSKGGELELFGGDFSDQAELGFIPVSANFDFICGVVDNGDSVTLYHCRRYEMKLIGFSGEKYKCQVIFLGANFDADSNLVFSEMSLTYYGLEYWFDAQGIHITYNISEDGTRITGADLRYRAVPEIKYDLSTCSIVFSFPTSIEPYQAKFSLRQTSSIRIIPVSPLNYASYHSEFIYSIRNFLTLGTGTAVLPKEVYGVTEAQPGEGLDKEKVRIFYAAKGYADHKTDLEEKQMLFYFDQIQENFGRYFEKWLALSFSLKPVIDIFFGIFYIPSMYLDLQFLTLTQALEAFHRRVYGGTYMSEEQYKLVAAQLEKAIPETLDSDHRASLKSKIKFGYEYSLRKRLAYLLEVALLPYSKTVARIVGDQKKFINDTVNTRNYLTHLTAELEAVTVKEPSKKYQLAQKLKLLVQLCFFAQMGFEPDTVEMVAKKSNLL